MAEFGIVGSNNDMHLGSSQSHSFRGDSLCTYNGTDQTRQTLIFNANDFNFHLDSTRRLLYRRNKILPLSDGAKTARSVSEARGGTTRLKRMPMRN